MNKIASKIKIMPMNKILWEVSPEIEGNKYVITSAADVPFSGKETYVFAGNENGEIIDWTDLPGSYRGDLNHNKCFENLGYTVNE